MLLVKPKEEEKNCYIHLGGNASGNCEVLMNNQNITSWGAPEGIRQGSTYTLNLDLKIKKSGTYYVRFRIEVKNGNQVLDNVVEITPPTDNTVEDGEGNTWYVYENVQGKSTIVLLDSITFLIDWTNEDLSGLNDSNAELNFYVDVFTN